ncbi:hypothetical protein GCM10023350_26710 [Nocardioides endophyticus]|uniref:Uncharacterized protein n=1 Tax=Nocardioides endophyticus TaxID=1353775 RepID=A0ABP8YWX4_9ACTN
MRITRAALIAAMAMALAGCAGQRDEAPAEAAVPDRAPDRFTIAPDDYHVPYAGTAEDGRRFFLSEELFGGRGGGSSYVGLFLWKADGTFDEVRVDEVSRPEGLPAGQAGPAGAQDLVDARLAELGDYVLEPIEVEPFIEKVDGVRFGWKVGRYDDGTHFVGIVPGDFIVYYAPWDGLDYDT